MSLSALLLAAAVTAAPAGAPDEARCRDLAAATLPATEEAHDLAIECVWRGTFDPPEFTSPLCRTGAQIPAADRRRMETLAREYLDVLRADGDDYATRLDDPMMSRESLAAARHEVLRLGPLLRPASVTALIALERATFMPRQVAVSAPCGRIALSGGLEAESGLVAVRLTTGPAEGTLYVALRRETGGDWKVRTFVFVPEKVAGLTGDQLAARGRALAGAGGDPLLAGLLLQAATGVTPDLNFTMGSIDHAVRRRERQALAAPAHLTDFDKPWPLAGREFALAFATTEASDGEFAVRLVLRPSDYADAGAARKAAQELLSAFDKAHPRWTEAFDRLTALAVFPDGRQVKVGFERGRGHYDLDAAAPFVAFRAPQPPEPEEKDVPEGMLEVADISEPRVVDFDGRRLQPARWVRVPDAEALRSHYPQKARDAELEGGVTLMCRAFTGGRVADCAVVTEEPEGWGFGEALLKSGVEMTAKPQFADGVPIDGGRLGVRVAFKIFEEPASEEECRKLAETRLPPDMKSANEALVCVSEYLDIRYTSQLCRLGDEIAVEDRRRLHARALAFLSALTAKRVGEAYVMLDRRARNAYPLHQFIAAVEQINDAGPYTTGGELRLMTLAEMSRVPDEVSGFDLVPCHDNWLVAMDASDVAIVHLSLKSKHDDRLLALGLKREGDDWMILSLGFLFERMAGRTAEDLFAAARAMAGEGGDPVLRGLLLAGHRSMILGSGMAIPQELMRNTDARETDPPPAYVSDFTKPWRLAGRDFEVSLAAVNSVDGRLSAVFLLPPAGIRDPKAAQDVNRIFIDAFIKTHPRWREVFDRVVVLSVDHNGKVYGTAYEVDRGYFEVDESGESLTTAANPTAATPVRGS